VVTWQSSFALNIDLFVIFYCLMALAWPMHYFSMLDFLFIAQ